MSIQLQKTFVYIYNDSYLIFIEASNLSHVNKKLPELNRGEGLISETLGVIFSCAEKNKQPCYRTYRCEVGSYNFKQRSTVNGQRCLHGV